MLRDVWTLVGAEAMRALDRHTIETLGVPGELLMESAGRAVVAAVLAERRHDAGVLVVCGAGNNGGDGFVVARHLHLLGVPVRIALAGEARRLRGDALANWKRCQTLGVPMAPARYRPEPGGVVVDAIFGTGLTRAVEGAAAAAIRRVNQSRPISRVVAVDLPSGIDADTGAVHGVAVEADVTVSIALPKLGLALEPGRAHAGRVRVARIGIADEAPGVEPAALLYTSSSVASRLPSRPAHGHKGSFGHVLVVAGSAGKTGAAALTASGAARVGAGLVTVACPESLNPVLEVKLTEAMTQPVAETAEQALGRSAEKAILELATSRDVVALGPGVGRAEETFDLVRRLAIGIDTPLLVDADGLVAFAGEPELLARRKAPTLLTPHPGEAAVLLGATPAEINANRPAAARELAERTGSVVVLKGAATVIAQLGALILNPTGGPLLAAGGTGDVLAGVVAGLAAQGASPIDAAAVGAYVHGRAADRLAEARDVGVMAHEVADAVPATLRELRQTQGGASLGAADVLDFPEPR